MPGAGFTRRYTFDPGLAEILKIEGVVIIDNDAPGNTVGETTGACIVVAEFEDGPFNTPLEIAGGVDQLNTLGGFGFTHDGLPSSNPCARARHADSAVNPEYWNGNGFLALASKTFQRLFVVRPDTSVGSVSFTKCPSVLGNANFAWSLNPGDTAVFRTAVGSTQTATFSAAASLLTTGTGSYPTGFAGGESFNVTIDGGTPLQIGPLDVVMTANEQSQAQVIARINAVLGFTCAVTSSGTVFTMSGRVKGNTGSVVVNSISGSVITTKLGLTAGQNAVGTGNVGNISQVTFGEVQSIIQAALTGGVVDRDPSGNLRVTATGATELLYTAASTADGLGIVEGFASQMPSGFAYLYSGAGIYPVTFASDTLTLGFDGDQNLTIAFANGSTTQAQVITAINTAFGRTVVTAASSTVLRFTGRANGGEVRVIAGTANALTALGLSIGKQDAIPNVDTFIEAGTRVRTAAGLEWLTMQTTTAPASSAGPFSIKVRPSLDDGTASGTGPGTVTTMVDPANGHAFSVTNPSALGAALTDGAIDGAYVIAMASTLDPSAVTKDANFITSARQSNAVRLGLRTNAATASKTLRGRVACVRPPLGTTRAAAKSNSSQPGVGATRSDRVFYCFPAWSQFIPQIAIRGTSGGAGFTADGFVDLGSDVSFAATAGLLPPEQNAGQLTDLIEYANAVEKNNPDVQGMTMDDYVAFKAAGIVAPRVADGSPIFQSDVTSDISSSTKADGPRRRFDDFANDSLAAISSPYAKKPMTAKRRAEVYGQFVSFWETLLNRADPDQARIDSYSVDAKSGNSPATLAAGAFRLKSKARMNPDMLVVVIDSTIGRTVNV